MNRIRKAILFLQIYPIITTIVFSIDMVLNVSDIGNITNKVICPLFGTSLFVTTGLYLISRSLYVSIWSRVLYIALIAATLIEFIDQFLNIMPPNIILQELLLLLFFSGAIISFITFLYDKFKYKF